MIYSVPIIINKGVNTVFVKANREICNTFDINDTDCLIYYWKKYFDAKLDLRNKVICFDTEKSKLQFILNFS